MFDDGRLFLFCLLSFYIGNSILDILYFHPSCAGVYIGEALAKTGAKTQAFRAEENEADLNYSTNVDFSTTSSSPNTGSKVCEIDY
jgi:hypothetical protein